MKRTNATKQYYDKYASLWTDRKTNSFHHERQFTKLVGLLPKHASVIDIGCASGIHVPLFLGIGRHLKYHGIDVSSSFLKIATRRYPQLKFTQSDVIDKKSLPKKKFDGFLAGAVLMHIPIEDWSVMLSNIESILKPKAFGYVTLPIAHPSGKDATTDPRHFTLLSAKEQRKQLTTRGWKICQSGSLDGTTTAGVWRWYIVQLP